MQRQVRRGARRGPPHALAAVVHFSKIVYMADEGDGQKPVTDMRIFCGEVKSRDALAWKVATAGSAMLSTSLQSGGLVQTTAFTSAAFGSVAFGFFSISTKVR